MSKKRKVSYEENVSEDGDHSVEVKDEVSDSDNEETSEEESTTDPRYTATNG